jgi:hypothetical protein
MKYSNEEIQASKERLKELLKAGDIVYTILRHVSSSGMMRWLSFYVIKDGEPIWITRDVAVLLGEPMKDDYMKRGGCGGDVGHSAVYGLSRALFDEFNCSGEKCPSNDHVNGDRDYTPHKHSDSGYSLKRVWL